MWAAVCNGAQAALMAPTEILAEQHYRGLEQQFAQLTDNFVGPMDSQNRRQADKFSIFRMGSNQLGQSLAIFLILQIMGQRYRMYLMGMFAVYGRNAQGSQAGPLRFQSLDQQAGAEAFEALQIDN